MAELHVERKESNPWPWIIAGLVLLALVLWFLFGRGDDPNDTIGVVDDTSAYAVPAVTDPVSGAGSAALTSFVQFADSQAMVADTGVAHDYTSTGLQRLIAALEEVTTRDTASSAAVQPLLSEMRAFNDSLQMNPQSTEHARFAREAFLAGASAMEQMQQSGMNLQASAVAAVRSAATELQPGGMLLEQIPTVRRFFEQSASALRDLT